MKKAFIFIAAALVALVSCREWEPVFTTEYDDVYMYEPGKLEVTATIAELKALYAKDGALKIEDDDMVIAGKVISDDHSGNIYRELYIQDETGVISVKIGLSSLYSDYKLGQTVYVRCGGLTIGSYNGMPQLGVEDPTGEYETAYLDSRYLIDAHVIRGAWGDPVAPTLVTEDELKAAIAEGYTNKLWGQLVTIEDLQYGAEPEYNTEAYKRIFILIYIDPYKDKKASTNRVFCSTQTFGVNTWAMSKNKFLEYLDNGCFDSCGSSDKGMDDIFDEKTSLTVKQTIRANATAITTSHYFHMPGGQSVQIRTSGYAKFADTAIDPAILGNPSERDGALCSATGILTVYSGAAQLALVDENSVKIQK
ncbi:MAG: hypothetical protein IJ611_05695 [Bacteroidales bacterium]|nr:hypothetical protein [Bacteroidales bacterium]